MSRSFFCFFKASWMLFSFFIIAAMSLAIYLCRPDPEAEAFYQQLNVANGKTDWNDYHLQQKRYGVVKEVLFNEDEELRKLRLECREAEIVFTEKEGKGEVLERMYDVIGRLQEKLYYVLPDGKLAYAETDTQGLPFQAISYFEADIALYSFRHESLTAEQVLLTRYTLPSHILPLSFTEAAPEMTGSARHVDFSLKDRKFNLHAQGFKGRFDALENAT